MADVDEGGDGSSACDVDEIDMLDLVLTAGRATTTLFLSMGILVHVAHFQVAISGKWLGPLDACGDFLSAR